METTSPDDPAGPVTPEQVEGAIAQTAARLPGVRPTDLPDFVNRDAGYSFLRIEGETLLLLAHERGQERYRRETTDLDELLYFVFHDVTRQLATRREAASRRRRGKRDTRRDWFPLWVSLMAGLDPAWGERTQAYVDGVLVRSPYGER